MAKSRSQTERRNGAPLSPGAAYQCAIAAFALSSVVAVVSGPQPLRAVEADASAPPRLSSYPPQGTSATRPEQPPASLPRTVETLTPDRSASSADGGGGAAQSRGQGGQSGARVILRAPRRPREPVITPATVPAMALPDIEEQLAIPRPSGPKLPQELKQTTDDPAEAAFAAFEDGRYQDALTLARQRIDTSNDAAAHTLIGRIFRDGLGIARDPVQAAAAFAKGAEGNDPNAQFSLAMMLLRGDGVGFDGARAVSLLDEAARAGLPDAQYNLALLRVEGRLVEPDMKGAIALLEMAAAQDHAQALYDLGGIHATGEGTARDESKAAAYVARAAARGLAAAQLEYAILLFKGRGVAQDKRQAHWYMTAAAEAGHPVAQNRLARMYAYGEGVEPSLVEAAKWHYLARAMGVADTAMDRYVARLTDEERGAAQTEASEWALRTGASFDFAPRITGQLGQ